MNSNRSKILFGVAAILLAILAWHWISGWGLVTVHAQDEPLAKILRSIERQGGIKIVTNADLTTAVSMDVDRVPPVVAVDTVAAWLDGNWAVSYAAGPAKSDVVAGITALQEGGRRGSADFARFGAGGFGGGGGMGGPTNTVIDARRVSWKVSPSDKEDLQSYLSQLAQKTGLSVIVPQSWNPSLGSTPKGGAAGNAIRDLVRAVKGEVQEVFVLRVEDAQIADAGGGGGSPDRGPRIEGGFGGGGPGAEGRAGFNPEWAKEREEARLALLPAAERESAKKDVDAMRDMWEKMRALPEAERRVAIDKLMNDPVVQDRMLERQMSREAQRSPEKRAERFRQYIQRKQQMKASS